MAEHVLFRYNFVAAVAPYVAGDWIEPRYEDTTGAIVVYDSSGVIFSGPDLGINAKDVNYLIPPATYREINNNYSFCDGTTLVYYTAQTAFPYVTRKTQANAPSCAITTPVCDLQIVLGGVTNASAATNGDGEIATSATSSAGGIKYALFDFDYVTEGQATGDFAGVYPGLYFVRAKDANGCEASVLVEVGVTNAAYEVRHRMDYRTIENELRRVDILEAGYVGAIEEDLVSDAPVRIVWRADNTEKTYPVVASTLEVDLHHSEAQGALHYLHLFTQDDTKFKVRHYTYNGAAYVLNWEGFIAPALYSEPYKALPYNITVQATDGLALLQDKLFLDQAGNSFERTLSVAEILAICLAKTGVFINIRVVAHIFETRQTVSATISPLEQTFVQASAYLDEEGNPKTCRQVLEYILTPFGARIVQSKGYWYITRIEELTADFDFVEYSFDGFDITQVGVGSYSPVKHIRRATTPNSVTPVDQALAMDMVPAYGKLNINYELGYLGGLLRFGNFEDPKYVTKLPSVGLGDTVAEEGPFIDKRFAPEWTLAKNGELGGVNTVQRFDQKEGWVTSIQNGYGLSYIQYKPVPVTYTANDYVSIKLRFKISQADLPRIDLSPTNTRSGPTGGTVTGPRSDRSTAGSFFKKDPPYVKFKWSVKLGSHFVLQYGGGTTDTGVGINESYISTYNEFVEITLDKVLLPDVSVETTEDLVVRVYSAYVLDSNFINLAALAIEPTVASYIGRRVTVTDRSTYGDVYFYELRDSTEATSSPDIVQPADYNGTTNTKKWYLIEQQANNSLSRDYNSVDISEVQVEFYPGGITPIGRKEGVRERPGTRSVIINDVEIQQGLVTPYNLNSKIRAGVDANFFHGDLPLIQNARYIYENYFALSDGSPTLSWTRVGEPEAATLHRIIAQLLIRWYKQPTWRLSGKLRADTSVGDLTPIDCLYTSTQEQKYYLIKSLTCNDKDKQFDVEMEEIKDGAVVAPDLGFTTGFTTGFNA
jgi:hypothetical protein